jgi:hypothetical protein
VCPINHDTNTGMRTEELRLTKALFLVISFYSPFLFFQPNYSFSSPQFLSPHFDVFMNFPLKLPHFYTLSTFQLGASEIIERAVQEPIIFIHNQFSIIRRLFLTSSRVLSYIHPTLRRTYCPTLQSVAVFESRLVHSSQQNKI